MIAYGGRPHTSSFLLARDIIELHAEFRRTSMLHKQFIIILVAALVIGAMLSSQPHAWLTRQCLAYAILCIALGILWFKVGLSQGTQTLLVGVHHWLWHPICVYRAWCVLYGARPTWQETICIIVHDWGYAGCDPVEGENGDQHAFRSSALPIIRWLDRGDTGRYAKLVRGHSRFMASQYGEEPSKLCWADKMAFAYDPWWWFAFRAWCSSELEDLRTISMYCEGIRESVSTRSWYAAIRHDLITTAQTRNARHYSER